MYALPLPMHQAVDMLAQADLERARGWTLKAVTKKEQQAIGKGQGAKGKPYKYILIYVYSIYVHIISYHMILAREPTMFFMK